MDAANAMGANYPHQNQSSPASLTDGGQVQTGGKGSVPPGQAKPASPPLSSVQPGPSLKEQKERLSQVVAKEKGLDKVRYKEYQEVEVGKEVEDWIEKMEKGEDMQLQQPVMDDYGQILLDNATTVKPQIILPLEEEEVRQGLHHKVVDSVRWLAEWCLRMIKLAGRRVEFKP